jgi:uncharacterized membrane protein YeaQ/YmgE (transglycosylase-associated protein family)
MTDIIETIIKTPVVCCGYLIIGFIAGALARRVMGGKDMPFVNDIVLGLLGALIGGFITSLLSIDTDNVKAADWIVTLIVATGGAMVLIFAGRILRGENRKRKR